MYSCPPMPPALCPPQCPPPKPKKGDPSSRYIREIGTAMIGNHLIIRMERDKGRSKKNTGWDPPCDCDVIEIQRPSSTEGPKILKRATNNRILFRVQSKSDVMKGDEGFGPQAISYEVGQCKGGQHTNDQCRTFTVYPALNGSGAQEVYTDRVTEGDENVFVLRVKKQPDFADQPKKNVELELRTPRQRTPPPPLRDPGGQSKDRVTFKDDKNYPPEGNGKKRKSKKRKKKK